MTLNWAQIKDALTQNDVDKIAVYRKRGCKFLDERSIQLYLRGHSIQSVTAASWSDTLLALKQNSNDLIAKFKLELLTEFVAKHGLIVYTDIKSIQPGDTVVTQWKYNKRYNLSHYRVLEQAEKQWIVSLSMWEHDAVQFDAHRKTETIDNKNFVVGVRQRTPPIMRKPHTFYFINFNN